MSPPFSQNPAEHHYNFNNSNHNNNNINNNNNNGSSTIRNLKGGGGGEEEALSSEASEPHSTPPSSVSSVSDDTVSSTSWNCSFLCTFCTLYLNIFLFLNDSFSSGLEGFMAFFFFQNWLCKNLFIVRDIYRFSLGNHLYFGTKLPYTKLFCTFHIFVVSHFLIK